MLTSLTGIGTASGVDPNVVVETDGSPAVDLAVDGAHAVAWLSGDIDMAVADHIVELGSLVVADPRVDELVIDLSRVTFLDSRGVGALVHLRNHAVTTDKRVALRRIPPTALKVLMLTNVGPSFGLTDTDTGRC